MVIFKHLLIGAGLLVIATMEYRFSGFWPLFFRGVCGGFAAMRFIEAYQAAKVMRPKRWMTMCDIPPKGWICTRMAGHQGPCAAWPDDSDECAKLRQVKGAR